MDEVRCGQCNKLLAKVKSVGNLEIKCPRCGTFNVSTLSAKPEHLECHIKGDQYDQKPSLRLDRR